MPLPQGVKFPPPTGYTGYNRKPITAVEVEQWNSDYHNLALGMPDNVIGIDVDTYRDKPGSDSVRVAEGYFGSELPPTWISSSKDHQVSGIRFYRVPPGVDWSTVTGTLGDAVAGAPGVDIIRPTHRYAVAHPSIHPSGSPYTWVSPTGEPCDPPRVDELPELPSLWLRGLTTRQPGTAGGDPATPAEREAMLGFFFRGRSKAVSKVLTDALSAQDSPDGSHYDAMVSATFSLVNLGADHAGVSEALEALLVRYVARVADARDEHQATGEFWRAVDGAIGKMSHDRPEVTKRVSLESVLATDLDVADVYVGQFGNKVRYTSDLGKWVGYSDGRWDRVGGDSVARRHFQDMIRELWAYKLITDNQGGTRREDDTPWLRSASRIGATLDHVRSNSRIQVLADTFNRMPMLFNCANGTVELVSGTLHPHDPEDMLTQRADVNFSPGATCPTFEKFLGEALPDAEVRGFVQRLFGMALLGEVRDHVFTVFTGTGRNGKGVLLEVAQAVFGNYSSGIHKDLLVKTTFEGHPTHLATLYGKRLAVAQELERGAKWDVARVKELTGGDRITARGMRENEYTFTPSHTIIMASNHRPTVGEGERAFWARYREVPFPVSFEGREDTTLATRIVANELDGVFQWMLQGLNDYLDHGLGNPDAVVEATREARSESDPLVRFAEETLRLTGNLNDTVPTGELWNKWTHWVDTQSDGIRYGHRNHFGKLISTSISTGISIVSAGRATVGGQKNMSVVEGVTWLVDTPSDGDGTPLVEMEVEMPVEMKTRSDLRRGDGGDEIEHKKESTEKSLEGAKTLSSSQLQVNKQIISTISTSPERVTTDSEVRRLPKPMSAEEFSAWWASNPEGWESDAA